MPRAGWLAVGGTLVALAAAAAGPAVAGAVSLVAIAAALAAAGVGICTGRAGLAAAGIGAGLVAARLMVGLLVLPAAPDPGPPPAGTLSWVGRIDRLGSTDGGMQRAVMSVAPVANAAASSPARVANPAASSPAPVARSNDPGSTGAGGGATTSPGEEGPSVTSAGPWTVYAWLPRYPIVAPGDAVSFRGSLELPDDPDFGDFLKGQGATATVRVGQMELLPRGGDALAALESLRRAAGGLLGRVLPEPEAGLAAGILIGLRDMVDRDLAADFTTAGLSHIVAISGWNIAVVGAVIVSLLRWLPRRPRSVAVLLAIVAYSVLAGASPSVVRAAVMGGVTLAARESGRGGRAATALGLAAWILLLVDPGMVTDVGFQLSVVATAGLLAWSERVQASVASRAPRHAPGWLVEATSVSLAAQAATLPLILFHFGRLSLIAPLANLLAAPIVAPAMLAGLVALVGGLVSALGAPLLLMVPIAVAGELGLGALVAVARITASVPLASLSLPPPLDLGAALIATILVGLIGTAAGRRIRMFAPWRRRAEPGPSRPSRQQSGGTQVRAASPVRPAAANARVRAPGRLAKMSLAVAAVVAISVAAVSAGRPDGRFRMTVLDVGQGDAILLEGSRGGRVLVDAGPDPNVLMRQLDARIPTWDRHLDLVVVTHPHEDHVGGMALLLTRYRVAAVADNGMLGSGPGDQAFRATLAELQIRPTTLTTGDRVRLDDAEVDVLWPRAGEVPLHPANGSSAVNNVSIVLEVCLAHRRILLTGDIQEDVDPQLLAQGLGRPTDPPVDVLKVAHHGSATATTADLLAAIRPSVAVISVGVGNPYGHPSAGALARLGAAGATTYRTDLDGPVTVTSDGTDLQVTTGRARAAPTSTAVVTVPTSTAVEAGPSVARLPSIARLAVAAGPSVARLAGSRPPLCRSACYDRGDARPQPRRGLPSPARGRAIAATPAPRHGGRRDRGLPRSQGGRARRGGRSPPRGVSRPAP